MQSSSASGSTLSIGSWEQVLQRSSASNVQWYRPWQQTMPPVIAVLRQHRLSYGVIFKGTYQDRTDRAYIAAAQQHILDWQATIKEPPDHVTIPELGASANEVYRRKPAPGTLPFLLNWYCEQTNVPGGCR